jgi:asparagine synthase (glutamine-hydrolysing)
MEQSRFCDAALFLQGWSHRPGHSVLEGLKRVAGAYSSGWLNQALRNINGMTAEPEWIRPGPLRDAGVTLAYPLLLRHRKMPGRRMMDDLAIALAERGLPGLLRHGDRNSMRFSVESRVPFLTPELADFALSLSEDYLVSLQGETKHILRSAMRGIVPDEVLDRKDKIGFATPEQQWLLGMTDTVRRWLIEDLRLPFFDQEKVCKHFDEIVAGRRPFSWQVWRWVNFCQWYKALA